MKKKIWTKISGAGNSFWLYYFPSSSIKAPLQNSWSQTAIAICQQKTKKLSADGLVAIFPLKTGNFKWIFRNADGSTAEMCGNAACCVVSYIFNKNLIPPHKKTFFLKTKKQSIKAGLHKKKPVIFIKPAEKITGPFKAEWKNKKIFYMFIDSGVPHAVIELKSWPKTDHAWKEKKVLAQVLRQNLKHNKKGMNVSFYYKKNKSTLLAKSFERGVEDFTPACGTGALAIAQTHHFKSSPNLKKIFIQMPGGVLEIKWHYDKTLCLMSPVKWQNKIEEKCLLTRLR